VLAKIGATLPFQPQKDVDVSQMSSPLNSFSFFVFFCLNQAPQVVVVKSHIVAEKNFLKKTENRKFKNS